MDMLEREGLGLRRRRTARTSCSPTTRGRRCINLRYGPDGNVYLIDWYDKQACHSGNPEDARPKTNGRIYKISHGDDKPVQVDLAEALERELVELQLQSRTTGTSATRGASSRNAAPTRQRTPR